MPGEHGAGVIFRTCGGAAAASLLSDNAPVDAGSLLSSGTYWNFTRQPGMASKRALVACFASISSPIGEVRHRSRGDGHSRPGPFLGSMVKKQRQGKEAKVEASAQSIEPGAGPEAKPKQVAHRTYVDENEETVYSDELEEGVPDDQDTSELCDPVSRVDKDAVSLFCTSCHKGLTSRDYDALECDGCHRWFHLTGKCTDKDGGHMRSPNRRQMLGEERWFHSDSCEKVHDSLNQVASKSNIQLSSGGRSWRLIPCKPPITTSRQLALGSVYGVLSTEWGYRMKDFSKFDYAAILKDQSDKPVCAALIDVYGADIAELFVITTLPNSRGHGHARALLKEALEPTLSSVGVRQLAASVDDDDDDKGALSFWERFGYKPLGGKELRAIGWSIPYFSKENQQGVNYLTKLLGKK